MTQAQPRWRKSSRSAADNACVELAYRGLLRDSKNPHDPTLTVDLQRLIQAAKEERL